MSKLNIGRVELIKQLGTEFPNGIGVEIGSFKGEFAKEIMQVWSGNLYMVDVWRGLGDEYLDSSNHNIHTTAYADAMESIKGYENRSVMVRADSIQAAELFLDYSLDFVYIDANHAYDFVIKDIETWYPKVKKGGYVLGHDYIDLDWYSDPNFATNGKDKHIYSANHYHGVFGVNPAVDEFFNNHKYEVDITNEWFGTWVVKK